MSSSKTIPKTIRIDPDLQEKLARVCPKGIPEHAVLLFLLELGTERAEKLKPGEILTAVTNHRIRVTIAAGERRQKAIEAEARAAELSMGGVEGDGDQ